MYQYMYIVNYTYVSTMKVWIKYRYTPVCMYSSISFILKFLWPNRTVKDLRHLKSFEKYNYYEIK